MKLYLDEPGRDAVRQLVASAEVTTTSVVAYPETLATLSRRRRERLMTPAEYKAAVRQFDEDWSRFAHIAVTEPLSRAAGRLAARHGLRGCDAVHLASFELLLARSDDDELHFSCDDEQLTRAARALD